MPLALGALAPPATAACLSDAEVRDLARAYQTLTPARNPRGLTLADAECSRARLNRLLGASLGDVVGYKAGLTSEAVQRRFNHDSPVRGTLYASMLLPNGTTVPAGFGARPLFEADLLVRVSDSAINRAATPAEVLAAIDQVIPFIELPDLMVDDPGQLDGAAIIAINVGARLGVMGPPVAARQDAAFAEALRSMQVIVRADGAELDRGRGSDVLGNPLHVVTWLVADLRRNGIALAPGDLLSLGSFSRLLPPQPGMAVAVEYRGLPGNPVVRVNFR